MREKVVIIYSGGMDSFTLLHQLIDEGFEVHALSFDYGQRHSIELEFATHVCRELVVKHKVVDLSDLNDVLQGSSLTSDIDVPEGHYSEDNMKATVVPNRNMIMLSIATGYAVSIGAGKVYTAVHAGDHAIYPDCRAGFIEAMTAVTRISNYEPVTIEAPYITFSKGDILIEGGVIGLTAYDYRKAWTCYKGGDFEDSDFEDAQPCGKCGACVERLEAFSHAGWDDPLPYDNLEFYKEAIESAK